MSDNDVKKDSAALPTQDAAGSVLEWPPLSQVEKLHLEGKLPSSVKEPVPANDEVKHPKARQAMLTVAGAAFGIYLAGRALLFPMSAYAQETAYNNTGDSTRIEQSDVAGVESKKEGNDSNKVSKQDAIEFILNGKTTYNSLTPEQKQALEYILRNDASDDKKDAGDKNMTSTPKMKSSSVPISSRGNFSLTNNSSPIFFSGNTISATLSYNYPAIDSTDKKHKLLFRDDSDLKDGTRLNGTISYDFDMPLVDLGSFRTTSITQFSTPLSSKGSGTNRFVDQTLRFSKTSESRTTVYGFGLFSESPDAVNLRGFKLMYGQSTPSINWGFGLDVYMNGKPVAIRSAYGSVDVGLGNKWVVSASGRYDAVSWTMKTGAAFYMSRDIALYGNGYVINVPGEMPGKNGVMTDANGNKVGLELGTKISVSKDMYVQPFVQYFSIPPQPTADRVNDFRFGLTLSANFSRQNENYAGYRRNDRKEFERMAFSRNPPERPIGFNNLSGPMNGPVANSLVQQRGSRFAIK